MEDQNYPLYMAITSHVLCDERLSSTEKLMLVIINTHKICKTNYQEFEDTLGIAPATVKRKIQHLEKLGYIRTVKNDGRGKTYKMVRGW